MQTDEEIKRAIVDELEWDARLGDLNIYVDVNKGQVTLNGSVASYPKKLSAERAVRNVEGVRGVDNELEVLLPAMHRRTDAEIKRAIENAITWNSSIDENKIKVTVNNGKVLLEGNVNWEYQRSKARLLAADTIGVIDIANLLNVEPDVSAPEEVLEKIIEAYRRNYYLDPDQIKVEVIGSRVILSGEVHTLAEKYAAQNIAWSARGITEVENHLEVHPLKVSA
jgi:osmotically-inducible protein OsmY